MMSMNVSLVCVSRIPKREFCVRKENEKTIVEKKIFFFVFFSVLFLSCVFLCSSCVFFVLLCFQHFSSTTKIVGKKKGRERKEFFEKAHR